VEKLRILGAIIGFGLAAVLVTGIGIEQIRAGGEGVSIGVRALIAAAFIWLFVLGGVWVLFKGGPAADATESASLDQSQPDATTRESVEPPRQA
jgi:hypothetical protein